MKYCGNCGSKLNDHIQFCGECGVRADETQLEPVKANVENPIKKMTKKQLMISSIAVSLLLILFVGYKIGSSMTSAESAIETFQDAVVEEDAEALSKWLYTSDDRLEVNEGTAEYFINYVNDHPSYLDQLISQFEKQAEKLTDKGKNKADADALGALLSQDSSLSLKQVGKTGLVFDKYRFEVKPYYINVDTNYPGSKVYMNGEEAFTFKEDEETKEYGPVMPGQYHIENVYEGEYTTLKAEETINLLESYQTPLVRMRLDGHFVKVRSNYQNAELFVNGNSTEKSVNESGRIGPVPTDGSVSLQTKKKFPWGEVTSDSVSIGDNSYYNVDLSPITEELQKEIFDVIASHNKQWIEASKNQDFSKYAHIGSGLKAGYKEDVESLKENKVKYYGQGIKEINYDLNSLSFNTNRNGDYEIRLKVRAAHKGDFIATNADKETLQEIDEESELDYYSKHYELKYDEQAEKWLIEKSRGLNFFERISDDTKKRTF